LRDHLTCHAGGLNRPAVGPALMAKRPCSVSIIGRSGP